MFLCKDILLQKKTIKYSSIPMTQSVLACLFFLFLGRQNNFTGLHWVLTGSREAPGVSSVSLLLRTSRRLSS